MIKSIALLLLLTYPTISLSQRIPTSIELFPSSNSSVLEDELYALVTQGSVEIIGGSSSSPTEPFKEVAYTIQVDIDNGEYTATPTPPGLVRERRATALKRAEEMVRKIEAREQFNSMQGGGPSAQAAPGGEEEEYYKMFMQTILFTKDLPQFILTRTWQDVILAFNYTNAQWYDIYRDADAYEFDLPILGNSDWDIYNFSVSNTPEYFELPTVNAYSQVNYVNYT